jgi:hypothetical protein
MENDYLIVLFKNKERYKIIKKYRKYQNAFNFYEKKLKESQEILFDIQTENGRDVKYEIALLSPANDEKSPIYVTDNLGRNIKVEVGDSNHSIAKISNYNYPEEVTNVKTNERYDMVSLINKFLKTTSLKLVSKLNNKIIIQDDEVFNVFSTKSIYDAERFLTLLEEYMMNSNKKNCILVRDTDVAQKKYLYEVLSNLGFNKKMLYRVSTTHLKDK